jgi:LPPG:FO 2-phospho-L-lactate transferase
MLGDSDVAVSMRRSQLLAEGVGLSEITEKISMALGSAGVEVLASSDHESLTMLRLAGGDLVPYSRWFVDRDAAEEIAEVVLSPAPASSGALERLGLADAVVLAPSNPVASLGAVPALGGMEEAFLGVPRRIGVLALSGRQPPAHPALARRLRAQARLLAAIGSSPAPAGHARLLSRWVTDLIVDDHDFEAIDASLRTYGPARHLRLIGASILDDPALASCIAGLLAEP